jgi:uncharacterized protein YndB with AHSA1/START domain
MPVAHLRLTIIPAVRAGMLIRKPADEVFRAFADPAITTRFWFTKSSGQMTPGAKLRWDWEMFGVSTQVIVKAVEDNRRILFEWSDDNPTTVELRFTSCGRDATFVEVAETGLHGDGDEIASYAAGSTGGFTMVLCALKALLEHGIVLTAVRDHNPAGLTS